MAQNFTDSYKTKMLQHVLMNVPFTPPAQVYLALFTSDPGPTGTGTEVAGNGYTRVPIPWTSVSVDPTTHEVSISNSAVVQFPRATGNWGTIGWDAIMDAQTGGAVIASAQLIDPRQVLANDTVSYELNALKVKLT